MKKKITLLVASVLMLCFASCGDSQYKLACGIGYEALGDNVKALKCYEKAVKSKDPEAMLHLGDFLINVQDTLVLNDTARAIELWNAAAEQNYTGAFNKLGYAYFEGKGVDKDLNKALEYFEKGAELDDVDCIMGAAEVCGEKALSSQSMAEGEKYTKKGMEYLEKVDINQLTREQAYKAEDLYRMLTIY